MSISADIYPNIFCQFQFFLLILIYNSLYISKLQTIGEDFSPCQEVAIWLTCEHAKTAEQKVAFFKRYRPLGDRYTLFCESQGKMPG